jgi:hypothetical protein
MLDLLPPPVRAGFEAQVQTTPDGRRVIPPLPYPHLGRIGAGGLAEAEVQRLLARRVPQAVATYTQPVRLTGAADGLPHTYVLCTDKGPGDPFAHFAERAWAWGWRRAELAAGHFPMLTTPRELTDALLQLV